jgi:cobalt-zinc-cadmium efflux system outer membrane protein
MSIPFLICRCALGAMVLLIGARVPLAHAQSEPLTLKDALAKAMAENPALRSSEYLLQALQARETRAAQRPPISMGAELEDFAGSGDLSGTDALQTTLRLSSVIELGGKRLARIAVAEGETEVAGLEQEARSLDLLAQVATRFAEVAARQAQLVITHESTRLAEVTAERVTERIRIGAAPQYELGRAEIRLARARIDEEHAEHELASAKVSLAATWGATTPQFERVSADLFRLPETATFAQLLEDIDSTPAIRLLLSKERLAEAQVNLARSARGLEIGWSGGVRHIESLDDTALVASVSVPFGARRRAEPGLHEAQALRAKVPLDLQATRVEANAALFELYQELTHARLEAQVLRREVQPQSERVLQSTEEAFRQGRTTFLEYANAQQQLLEVRRDAVAAAARYHTLLIEIERLTGAAFSADGASRGEDQ